MWGGRWLSVHLDRDFSVLTEVGLGAGKPRFAEFEGGHRRACRTIPHFGPLKLDLHHEQVRILRPTGPPDLLLLVPQHLGALWIALHKRLACDGEIDLL